MGLSDMFSSGAAKAKRAAKSVELRARNAELDKQLHAAQQNFNEEHARAVGTVRRLTCAMAAPDLPQSPTVNGARNGVLTAVQDAAQDGQHLLIDLYEETIAVLERHGEMDLAKRVRKLLQGA